MTTDNPAGTAVARALPVCAIGAPAGDIEALTGLFGTLPADRGLAYVVLAPDHADALPAILAQHTRMPVMQVGGQAEPLRPDHVYVIATDRRPVISDTWVAAERAKEPLGQRLAIELLCRCLAETRGGGLAVMLFGTGADRLLGTGAATDRGGPPPARELDSATEEEWRAKLHQAEQRLESMRDEQALISEELRAAEEALRSLTDEYRCTAEALECDKEAWEGFNEELRTVNDALKLKLDELFGAHTDLESLMSATDVAALLLDRQLCIKCFTPPLGEIFNVRVRDRGRPIGDLTHCLDYDSLGPDARGVLADARPIEREVRSRDGRTFLLRLRPYRPAASGTADGVAVAIVDVSALKSAGSGGLHSDRGE